MPTMAIYDEDDNKVEEWECSPTECEAHAYIADSVRYAAEDAEEGEEERAVAEIKARLHKSVDDAGWDPLDD